MEQYIILAIGLLAIAAAIIYVVKQKKKGVKCIGCPHGECNKCNCGCASQKKND